MKPEKIASFTVDHTTLLPGIYVSRIDGDITTYDLRTRRPNHGDYMDHITMHSLEHMFATFIRSSEIKDDVIYFGPMGCQTGFYLLIRNADNNKVLEIVKNTLKQVLEGQEMYGQSEIECGNYKNLSLNAAKEEAAKYLQILTSETQTFTYK